MEAEWGRTKDQGGKVQCVRRFGLAPEEEEESEMGSEILGQDTETRRKMSKNMVRHITAVQMSEHVAEDVSCWSPSFMVWFPG